MSLRRHLDWIRNDALPFWFARAVDHNGLFYEVLDLDGAPLPGAELRLRTGMRQVYVFAEAARLGLCEGPKALALAEKIVERLRDVAWSPNGRGGWAARFMRDGEITDQRRDLYDHAFALLALGSLVRITNRPRYYRWIDETLATVDSLRVAQGGWAESDRGELPRRQNPHMHLFEASLALFEATNEKRHLARAEEILGLLYNRFFDAEAGVLIEFFGPGWERASQYRSERLDPGHMAEWTWLLRRFERTGGQNVKNLCTSLLGAASRLGLDADGFLMDEIDSTGNPLVDRRRLWPQTEYLKALIVEGAAHSRPALLDQANVFADRLHDAYLTSVPRGGWCDQFNLAGKRTASNIPASTFYHLFAVAVEILHLEPS